MRKDFCWYKRNSNDFAEAIYHIRGGKNEMRSLHFHYIETNRKTNTIEQFIRHGSFDDFSKNHSHFCVDTEWNVIIGKSADKMKEHVHERGSKQMKRKWERKTWANWKKKNKQNRHLYNPSRQINVANEFRLKMVYHLNLGSFFSPCNANIQHANVHILILSYGLEIIISNKIDGMTAIYNPINWPNQKWINNDIAVISHNWTHYVEPRFV